MTWKTFYLDPISGRAVSYEQLAHDLVGMRNSYAEAQPTAFQASDFYDLFCNLLAAIQHHRRIALVRDQPLAEELGRDPFMGDVPPADACLADASAWQVEGGSLRDNYGDGRDSAADCDWAELVRNSAARIGIYTSGTEGRAKLVWHSLPTLTRGVRIGANHADDVWGFCYHPAHFAGLQVFFQAVMNGNPLIRLFQLPPQHLHAAIEQHRITHLSATPTFLNLLCDASTVHASVRRISVGGETLTEQLARSIARTFPSAKITNIYASSEAGSLLIGRGEQFVVPADLRDRIRVEDGELCIHRSLLAESLDGSRDNEDSPTEEHSVQNFVDDFYRTGDRVEIITAQPLTIRFAGRLGELINVGGYKVNPAEVESQLNELPEVVASRVFGVKNSVTGQLVACEVQLEAGASLSAADVRERLGNQLSSYQLPRIVNIVERLEMTSTGKLRRGS